MAQDSPPRTSLPRPSMDRRSLPSSIMASSIQEETDNESAHDTVPGSQDATTPTQKNVPVPALTVPPRSLLSSGSYAKSSTSSNTLATTHSSSSTNASSSTDVVASWDVEKGPRPKNDSSTDSEDDEKEYIVPGKKYAKPVRNFRHILFTVYRRLFSVVLLLNILAAVLYYVLRDEHHGPNRQRPKAADFSTAAAANILLGVLVRQDYLVNSMFRLFWKIPLSAPLRFRRIMTKVYEYGGLHSGSGVCGTLWLIAFAVTLTVDTAHDDVDSPAALALAYVLMALLVVMCLSAYPRFRVLMHNAFERIHRFAGWSAVALFWAELFVLADYTRKHVTMRSLGRELVCTPTFWMLIVITFHIILPWLSLRRVYFRAERLSEHALRLYTDEPVDFVAGLQLSTSPLTEWHPFATFRNDTHPVYGSGRTSGPRAPGGSLIVSMAGDWTKRNIADPRPYYWVRSIPRTGVLSMATLYRKVVVVTTGSGIGPCLSFLLDPARRQPVRLIWSTPSPEKTFGQKICDTARNVDPQAIIHDTRTMGRPDMVAMAYRAYREFEAEAVFIISNPKLTKKFVYDLECRGIPAFGPIWDS